MNACIYSFMYRLFNVLCWLWNIRGSGAPECIFHNEHKTLYNLFSPDPAVPVLLTHRPHIVKYTFYVVFCCISFGSMSFRF